MEEATYGADFFRGLRESAGPSARVVVPWLRELIDPRSVVDVGCGTGAWLAAFERCGAVDIVGLDGDYVDTTALEIPRAAFLEADLGAPLPLRRRFDLAVCLEVAEHLPGARAAGFVGELTALSEVVLFSAAVPGQGGIRHVNEQWPGYWVERFREHGFSALDGLRQRFWDDPAVAWWYAQNLLLFVQAERLARDAALQALPAAGAGMPLSVVHPRKLDEATWEAAFWRALAEVRDVVPAHERFVLIDGGSFFQRLEHDPRVLPCPERDGGFFGLPADGVSAVSELRRLVATGAAYVVILWPAFWWLDHYAELRAYLESGASLLLGNERVMVMRTGRPAPGAAR